MPENAIITADHEISQWDQALYGFLAEKQRRSDSDRTVQSYARMLKHAVATFGITPDRVTRQDVFGWAHGIGLSGRAPSRVTVGARIACLSSFYRFLIRMGLVVSNPCDALERPRTEPSQPRGLTASDIQRLLAVIPDTRVGLRDRAIVLTLTLTGRRRAEVMSLTAGSLFREGNTAFYEYRGKGNKRGKRELPPPAFDAIITALAAWGKNLASMQPDESLWPSAGSTKGLTSGTFYGHLQRYLQQAGLARAGVHIFRHSAAKLRRDAGESVEEVSHFLDHSSLAVTTTYLRRLQGQEDRTWSRVAAAIGV